MYFWVTVMHLLALIAALDNGLTWLVKTIIVVAIIISFLYVSLENRREKRIFGYGDNGWYLESNEGEITSVSLMGSSVATPFFIFVHMKSERSTPFSFLIFRDSLNRESYRRLRVLLTIVGAK